MQKFNATQQGSDCSRAVEVKITRRSGSRPNVTGGYAAEEASPERSKSTGGRAYDEHLERAAAGQDLGLDLLVRLLELAELGLIGGGDDVAEDLEQQDDRRLDEARRDDAERIRSVVRRHVKPAPNTPESAPGAPAGRDGGRSSHIAASISG